MTVGNRQTRQKGKQMSNASALEYAEDLADTIRNETPDTLPDIGEYLESILDYQYTRDSQGDLVSVRLLVTYGGPNAWVTFDGDGALIEASWYSDTQRIYVDDAPMSGPILDYFQDILA